MKTISKQQTWSLAPRVATLVMAATLCHPAFASGGGSGSAGGGGGNAGGGGGKAGGGMISTSVTCDDWGDRFNGELPQGQATFAYSADGSSKSLSVQVSSINIADGTVMYLETEEIWPTATGTAWSIVYYPVTIRQGRGTLSLSTANGDAVTFLLPSTGETFLYLWNSSLQIPLMGAQLGHLN